MKDVATLCSHQAGSFPVKKDETNMREQAKGILKSLPASSRSFSNRFDLSEIFAEEGDDLVRFPIIEGAGHNSVRLE
jgi:hypothetical protein